MKERVVPDAASQCKLQKVRNIVAKLQTKETNNKYLAGL